MKLICTQEKFKKALFNSEKITSKQNTLPVLSNVLLEANKNFFKISATNLEIGIEIKIGAKIEREGKIIIPARFLGNFSSNLSGNENMEIETVGQNLKIKNGRTKAIIKGFSAEEFPLIPQKNTEAFLKLNTEVLRNIFAKIIASVAHNEARQELTGVNVIFAEKEILFAATDGFRLAEYVLKITENEINEENYKAFLEKNKSVIIPAGTIVELNKIISNFLENSAVDIIIEEGQIFFEFAGIKMVSRLINGKYPEYKHIMPKSYKTTIIGDKKVLQSALKMASVFADSKANEVVFKIDAQEKKILIDTKSVEAGENSTELNFEVQGETQEVVFNLKYLLDGINTLATDNIVLFVNSETSPVALKELDEKTGQPAENFTYIVMPIKN
ncbi:MAG TPA: DNA polymerase III subunit beta [Candidatus Moranbacteria bacterium]|nr:DNA polymerase III subunit beta [Candidatus Moranbacteria bacterium]HAT75114.1 DNA polymerase III subunit beta [Candidatus Moranbacteria bacterium]